jgi:hypothetical protein
MNVCPTDFSAGAETENRGPKNPCDHLPHSTGIDNGQITGMISPVRREGAILFAIPRASASVFIASGPSREKNM